MTDGYGVFAHDYIYVASDRPPPGVFAFDWRMWRKQRVDTALRGRIIRRVLAPPIRYREIGRLRRVR